MLDDDILAEAQHVHKIADEAFERFFERTLLWYDAVQHIRDAAASDVGK